MNTTAHSSLRSFACFAAVFVAGAANAAISDFTRTTVPNWNGREGVAFVREVDVPAVKVMLDTFHMNIEEDSIGGAIRSAKGLLGHFHTGECNRRVPGRGRTPWHEIATALADIGYDGTVCMEPFVRMGGKVGEDIKIWRELEPGIDEAKMDADAKAALDFERIVFEGAR